MKLRIIKNGDKFIPQYYDEEARFPSWNECRLDNTLVAHTYFDMDAAMRVIERFKENHPAPEVVWSEEY